MMYALYSAQDEDQVFDDEGVDDEDEDETEDSGDDDLDDDEEDEDEDEDEEGLHNAMYHACPIHSAEWPLDQPSYYQDLDPYLSDDDLDQSEGAGPAPVDYAVSHLLADDVDMDYALEYDSEVGFTWLEEPESNPPSAPVADPAFAAGFQAVAVAAGALDAAYANTAPPLPATDLGPGAAAWGHIYQFSVSNPNPTTIGPSNYGLTDFLRHWARQSRILQNVSRGPCPWPARVNSLETCQPASIEYEDLEGDQCDFQGVDWEDIGVTRKDARERRLLTYSNYVNIPGSDRWTVSGERARPSPFKIGNHCCSFISQPNLPDVALPRNESFFRFRRMDIRRNIHLSHFQLRHVFASTSRSRVFYPSIGAVQQFNPVSGHGRAIMRLSDAPASQISTLATGHGVLVAGGFGGEYILRHLDSGEPEDTACHEGVITSSISGITNHIDVHRSRTSSTPLAAFASNDNVLRVLDINTETWLSQETHDFAPNCTALSPDGRLRVMVGDTLDVVITAAESSRRSDGGEPDIMQRLSGHRDYGFACDWADDGWTIATAFQDKTVKIWDARRFTDSAGNAASVCTIRSEMAGVRSLRFSPIGSGKRVLVAAEEADFVNIIDAQTFRSKQTVDVFGELGGITFENAGQDLMVLCCDRTRGGILQLERCGLGDESVCDSDEEEFAYGARYPRQHRRRGSTHDWPRSMFTEDRRFKESASRRRRKAAMDVEMDPF
jgi:hypothetical protein